MKTIWKTVVDLGENVCRFPGNYVKPLNVKFQGDDLCLWLLVDKSEPYHGHKVKVVFTGEDFDPTGYEYVGTDMDKRGLVYHVWFQTDVPVEKR